jgi:alpha-beta hydrolase superfamily lysophospholipase
VPATDGTTVQFRTTAAAAADGAQPQGVLVFMTGTAMPKETFDLPGDELAGRGIASYAVQSRTSAPATVQHANDLESVLAVARAEHPGVPIAIGGVSLGGDIALYDDVLHGDEGGRPTIAISPVFLEKFLSNKDRAFVAGGLVNHGLAERPVDTPMSAGKLLTHNPASEEAKIADPNIHVPAGLFDDVARMATEITLHGRRTNAPLMVAMAGADQVNLNFASRAIARLVGSSNRTVLSVGGAAHDLPQENSPAFFDAMAKFITDNGVRDMVPGIR